MRIVSLAPSATELVFALGFGEQLIGRTAFCDYPPEAKTTPVVGGWTTANVESVVPLQPDLVLTSTFLQDSIVAALRERGMNVCHTDPRTLPDVLQSFETTAAALGIPHRGRELRGQVESQLLPSPAADAFSSLRVYAEEWHQPPMASGNWVPDLITVAGGKSFLRPGERSRKVSLEEIQGFDPDMVILNYCGMEHVPAAAQAQYLSAREGWQHLRAVRAGRIVVIQDSLLNRPGPRLSEGAQALHRALAGLSVTA